MLSGFHCPFYQRSFFPLLAMPQNMHPPFSLPTRTEWRSLLAWPWVCRSFLSPSIQGRDLSFVGSATQIAVLVIPVTIILSWIMGQPLDLDFEWFEAFTLFLCTIIAIISVNDGTTNWIKGLLLMMTYTFVSAAFWVHADRDLTEEK